MSVLMLLFPVLMLVALGAFVWLVVRAFKLHAGWGVCVLLLSPIAAIVFAVKHWREARAPFLLYTGTFVAAVVLGFATVARIGAGMLGMAQQEMQAELQRVEPQLPNAIEQAGEPAQEPLAEPAPDPAAGTGPGDEPSDAGAVATDAAALDAPSTEAEEILDAMAPTPELAAPAAAPPAAAPAAPTGEAVAHADLGLLVGQKVRVRTTSGGVHRGRLTRVSASGILLDIDLGAGSVSYEIDFDELDSVHALMQ